MRLRISSAISLVLALSVGVSASPVFTTNFSEYAVAGPHGYDSVAAGTYGAITVGGGGVDWISTCWTSPTGGNSIDLNMGGGDPGWIRVDLPENLTAGRQYDLVFSLSGNPDLMTYKAGHPTASTTVSMMVSVGNLGTGTTTSESYDFDIENRFGPGQANSRNNMGWIAHTFSFTADGTENYLMFASTSYGTMWGPVIGGAQIIALSSGS